MPTPKTRFHRRFAMMVVKRGFSAEVSHLPNSPMVFDSFDSVTGLPNITEAGTTSFGFAS